MRRVLVCLMTFLLATGCESISSAKELEATMLVQVLGVDWVDDKVVLTAASDPGTGSGGAKTAVLSAEGKELEEAKKELEAAGEERVALTHVAQIVLGEGTKLSKVLDAALNDSALGQGATVWVSEKGTAEVLLKAVDGGAKRLASIEINTGVKPVTVLQSMMRLEEQGWVDLPVLQREKDTLVLGEMVRIEAEEITGAG